MFTIDTFDFDDNARQNIAGLKHHGTNVGEDWPVVYVINNDQEAYIGETVNAARRAEQHRQNPERRKLTEIRIISDEGFNKSVVLDLESFLIRHMSSDGKYVLQNGNSGLQDHNYYERSRYEEEFRNIWNKLRKLGVVDNTITEIENSELFKYSPYKSLGAEQKEAELEIVSALSTHLHRSGRTTILVKGGAGTGKTILAIYLLKLFADIRDEGFDPENEDYSEEDVEFIFSSENISGINKIGLVLPQASLRTSLREVFKQVKGLDESMILSPKDVAKDYAATGIKYDLLLVDEAHRLRCRDTGNIFDQKAFKGCNILLGLDEKHGTELDWILMCSKNQIFFRDDLQSIRKCDIDPTRFNSRIAPGDDDVLVENALETQWRCKGGNGYINYLNELLNQRVTERREFADYDFKLYMDVDKMFKDIREKDSEYGLCRTVAGYAWEWVTKSDPKKYDIEILGHRYRWNSTYDNWIMKPNAVNEIGCIHTVQGYDLNYAGVIIGKDLYLDTSDGIIKADKTNYFDSLGKAGLSNDPEGLTMYIKNIYLTLMTRGIRGTYVYVCDDALREYMAKYIDIQQ